ncbi:MAG TPA: hypothetical protein VFY84_15925 [Jiangellales bacterium]|nr:hypothetical protein [Jiangellales bacterium]
MKSRTVRLRKIQVNMLTNRRKSYTVRWVVANQAMSRTFASRALADHFRSDLMQAVNKGEAFDVDSGLPDSMMPARDSITWLELVRRYVDMKWPAAAAKSRDSITDSLATVTPTLVRDDPGRPDGLLLRRALREHELPPSTRLQTRPLEIIAALRWLEKASLPLHDLIEAANVRPALETLALRMDGRAAAATTTRRRRAVFYNVLQYAVELELLAYNPIDKLRIRATQRKLVTEVDRRVVVNPRQARELLVAATYIGRRGKDSRRGERLYAFFACLYYAALRPSEALDLRLAEIRLGSHYGRRSGSRPTAGKRYTDSGAVHDDRGLKHRGGGEARHVPIPPELVRILRPRTVRRRRRRSLVSQRPGQRRRLVHLLPHLGGSACPRIDARPVRLPARWPAIRSTNAGVSLWLNAGVPATEVAERAGHSVDVLLKVYAKCLDGDRDRMNARIEAALAD